ncbi:hypothetical protein [Actinoplanes xinjiangensis]|uniref:hypothetical protein n=1 Tax=Actinoplanes xinjiangensis TaxID=512350 RepID=UPI0034478BE8
MNPAEPIPVLQRCLHRQVVSSAEQDSFAEQVEACAAVHLPLDHLDPVNVAFDGVVAIRQGQASGDSVQVTDQTGRNPVTPGSAAC